MRDPNEGSRADDVIHRLGEIGLGDRTRRSHPRPRSLDGRDGVRAEIVRACPRCGEQTRRPRCPRCDVTAWWEPVVELDEPTVDGRTVLRSSHSSRAEAEIALRRLLDEHDTSHPPLRPEITLGEYLAEVWLPTMRRSVDEVAWRSYHDELHRHVIARIGDEPLDPSWVRRPIERLVGTLPTDGRLDGQGGLSPRTVRYIWNLLRRALDDAVTVDSMLEHGWIVGDPRECAHHLNQLYDAVGGFGYGLTTTHDPDDHALEQTCLRLLMAEVAPRLKGIGAS
jgi:hypothetical protein